MLVLIGGLFFTSFLTPPLAAMIKQSIGIVILVIALTVLAGSFSAASIWNGSITSWQWTQCELVLGTFLLGIAFFVRLLIRVGCDQIVASAIVTLLVLAWLTAPVWLSVPLQGCQLHYSVAVHPLFVLNGIVPQLGIWTEQQVAYGLTSMGQDVQYALPGSPWLAVGVYGAIAATCGMIVAWASRP
jgi:hypothetical protein